MSGGEPLYRRIARKAFGARLPRRAHVAHIAGRLVICNNGAHRLYMAYRERAFMATGDATFRQCCYCKQWGSPNDVVEIPRYRDSRVGFRRYHNACNAASQRKVRRSR